MNPDRRNTHHLSYFSVYWLDKSGTVNQLGISRLAWPTRQLHGNFENFRLKFIHSLSIKNGMTTHIPSQPEQRHFSAQPNQLVISSQPAATLRQSVSGLTRLSHQEGVSNYNCPFLLRVLNQIKSLHCSALQLPTEEFEGSLLKGLIRKCRNLMVFNTLFHTTPSGEFHKGKCNNIIEVGEEGREEYYEGRGSLGCDVRYNMGSPASN